VNKLGNKLWNNLVNNLENKLWNNLVYNLGNKLGNIPRNNINYKHDVTLSLLFTPTLKFVHSKYDNVLSRLAYNWSQTPT
jgi:hypothetical protein